MRHRHPLVFVNRIVGADVLVSADNLFVKLSQGLVFASEFFREKTVVFKNREDEPRAYIWLPILGQLNSGADCLCDFELDWERLPDDVQGVLYIKR